jgi:hypothetical protein
MSGTRTSIGVVMKLTVIIALNLAAFRVLDDPSIFLAPPFLFLLVLLDHAIIQFFVFGRPLGTFYFTFLVVGVFSTAAGTAFAMMQSRQSVPGSFYILEAAIQNLRAAPGQNRVISPYTEFPILATAERSLTSVLCFLPAWAAAAAASGWMRRPYRRKSRWGQTVLGFFQGALVGLALSFPGVLVADWFLSSQKRQPQTAWIIPSWLITCALIGGLALATRAYRYWSKHQAEAPKLA